MSEMSLSVRDDGLVTANGSTNDTQWVCHLEDTHSQYRFERNFIAYEAAGDDGCAGCETLEDGAVLEHVIESGAEEKTRLYWQVSLTGARATLERTTAKDAEAMLD
jgi:hypothetical protein